MSKRKMLLCLLLVFVCVVALSFIRVEVYSGVFGGASPLWVDAGYGSPAGSSLGQNTSFGVGVSSWLPLLEVGLTAVISVCCVAMAVMMYRFGRPVVRA